MTFIPTPDCARVVIHFAHGSETWSNVLHYTKGDFNDAELEALADLIDANEASNFKGIMSVDNSYVGVTAYDIRASDGSAFFNNDGAGAGTQSGDALPISTSMVVTLRTSARGRSGRGRLYIAGFEEAVWDGAAFTGAMVTSVVAIVNELRTQMAGQGWTQVIRSTQQDGVKLTTAVTRPVVSAECRSALPGQQRRRIDRP